VLVMCHLLILERRWRLDCAGDVSLAHLGEEVELGLHINKKLILLIHSSFNRLFICLQNASSIRLYILRLRVKLTESRNCN